MTEAKPSQEYKIPGQTTEVLAPMQRTTALTKEEHELSLSKGSSSLY
jgi:hypothetical protein